MEYIKANGTEYKCQTVTTGIDSVSFTIESGDIEDIYNAFKNVKELTVSGEDKAIYGIYNNLSFSYVTVNAEGIISVSMNIRTDLETRVENLESSQSIYDEAISELADVVGGMYNA